MSKIICGITWIFPFSIGHLTYFLWPVPCHFRFGVKPPNFKLKWGINLRSQSLQMIKVFEQYFCTFVLFILSSGVYFVSDDVSEWVQWRGKCLFVPFYQGAPSLSQKIDARKLRCRRKCHLGHSRSPAFNMKTTFCRYGKFVASYHPFTRANILTKARGTMQECYHLYFSFCRRFKTRHPSTFPAASLHLKANSDFF